MAGKPHQGLKKSTKGDPVPAKKKVLPVANIKPGSGKASTRKPSPTKHRQRVKNKGK